MIATLLVEEPLAASGALSALETHWPTLLVVVVGVVVCLFLAGAVARLNRLVDTERGELERLKRIESALGRIAESHGDLDLRRLEHVLIDIRDGIRRQDERLLTLADALSQRREVAMAPERPGGASSDSGGVALRDRIISRLLALGFERIELLNGSDELEALVAGEGEVTVEARRAGAWHKGRVKVRAGAIADVSMRASFEAFP